MDPTYSITEWALFALTGEMSATSPTPEQLEPLVASVVAQLSAAYPCIGADPLTDLTSQADLDAFAEWAGYVVAMRYVQTPAGATVASAGGGSVREKSGRVERTVTQPTATAKAADYRRAGNAARLRIACIREAVAEKNRNSSGMVDVVGRRRAIGTDGTIEGGLLGLGRRY